MLHQPPTNHSSPYKDTPKYLKLKVLIVLILSKGINVIKGFNIRIQMCFTQLPIQSSPQGLGLKGPSGPESPVFNILVITPAAPGVCKLHEAGEAGVWEAEVWAAVSRRGAGPGRGRWWRGRGRPGSPGVTSQHRTRGITDISIIRALYHTFL